MSATPTSPDPDLSRLEAEGFRLQIIHGSAHHLLVSGIPAVAPNRTVQLGTLYSPLELDPDGLLLRPVPNHQCWWVGQPPCDANGRVMDEMISNHGPEEKGDGIRTNLAFSRKLAGQKPYPNIYEKIWTYVRLLWHEAKEIDPNCDPRSSTVVPAVVEANTRIFNYPDMATTRAGIGAATAKLLSQRVAIIGIGGTGAYILDLVAKTPVEEIHIFDGDEFKLHNAFRSPGAPSKEQLTDPKKVDWFGDAYDRMRAGIVRHPYHVEEKHLAEFKDFDFVFVAVDDGEARKTILEGLMTMNRRFIDVGMDVAFDPEGFLRGMMRVTTGVPGHYGHISEVVSFASQKADLVYRNIQVADLNMQNAAMAVIKWKKLCGFYADDKKEHHSLYTTSSHGLTKEDIG